jgi:hypothetical protein
MAKYKITATYEYSGVVEADNLTNAEKVFLDELNDHYVGTESYEVEEVCDNCEADLDLDNSCFSCRDEDSTEGGE